MTKTTIFLSTKFEGQKPIRYKAANLFLPSPLLKNKKAIEIAVHPTDFEALVSNQAHLKLNDSATAIENLIEIVYHDNTIVDKQKDNY